MIRAWLESAANAQAKLRLVECSEDESRCVLSADEGELNFDFSQAVVSSSSSSPALQPLCAKLSFWAQWVAQPQPQPPQLLTRAAQTLLCDVRHAHWAASRTASLAERLAAERASLQRVPPHARSPRGPADAAEAALLAGVLGSAGGSALDGTRRPPTHEEASDALLLPGGRCGALWLAPGQAAEDGVLLVVVARACAAAAAAAGRTPLLQALAAELEQWRAASQSQQLTAAGVLAQLAPIAVLAHRLPAETQATLAAQTVAELLAPALVEKTPGLKAACACYAVAVAHLIAFPGDRARHEHAFESARFVADMPEFTSSSAGAWLDAASGLRDADRAATGNLGSLLLLLGPLGMAVCVAFGHLLRRTPIVDALAEVALLGGDVSSNMAVTGALLGAFWGKWAIPNCLIEAILDPPAAERFGTILPDFLQQRQIPALAKTIAEAAPEELQS